MAERKYGAPAAPTHEKIVGIDCYQHKITEQDRSHVLFVGGDWTEAEIMRCVFNGWNATLKVLPLSQRRFRRAA